VNTLVVMEAFHLFFIRSIYGTSLTWKAVRGTKIVWATVIAITVAQLAATYRPPLQRVLRQSRHRYWMDCSSLALAPRCLQSSRRRSSCGFVSGS
jgi:magnesium-transporting ATPase (P-type)